MTAAIDLITRKLTGSEYSHQASWAHLRANQLRQVGIAVDVLDGPREKNEDPWVNYDTIFIYQGMDHKPNTLNVFDGMVESAARFFERVGLPVHDNRTLLSLDHAMPDYGKMCKDKKGERSAYWAAVDWDRVSARCATIPMIPDPFLHFTPGEVRHLAVGDSHTHSAYNGRAMVLRKDGRTMAGVLRKGIDVEIAEAGFDLAQIDSLTCYWGNIDIRHHLCRETDPVASAKAMLKTYEHALITLNKKIELVTPLPVEDESRVLPKSGYYKGTPFYGTQAQRQELVKIFKQELGEMAVRNGWELFAWPSLWYEMDGIEFMSTYMERPRSVHLARRYYRWDLVNNTSNPLMVGGSRSPLLVF